MFRNICLIVLVALLAVSTGCRPETCAQAGPLIDKVGTALDDGRMDAASSGLTEIEKVFGDDAAFLVGFSARSGALRDLIEKQHNLGGVSARERDFTERRLSPLIEGWQREARAVERRCATGYLL